MNIIDFTHKHMEEATALAKASYEQERQFVPVLPPVDIVPDLTSYADNGLGVAVFENSRMIGFICCVSPFDNAFRSTYVKGVFTPMGATAAIQENKAKIYAAMYQAAAQKWIDAGAVSHGICLYAHDEIAQQQFFHYGFGLRCIDAIRLMEEIEIPPCTGYLLIELESIDFKSVYPLHLMLSDHMKKSPTFMCHPVKSEKSFYESCLDEKARYFVAETNERICAFLKISDHAETFVCDDNSMKNITGAFCLPEHRGKGVYQSLLNHTISTLKNEGYTRLGVDFESINPTAYGFWLKYFTAYTHGIVRRIDEFILESKIRYDG